MSLNTLTALRLIRPAEFRRKVRAALQKAGSVPGAAKLLTARGLTCSRGTLFRVLRADSTLEEGLELPGKRGYPRGSVRPDKRPDWTPSPDTLTRRARRAARRTGAK